VKTIRNGAIRSVQSIFCHITAPIAGRLGLRLVDPGKRVPILRDRDPRGYYTLEPITVFSPYRKTVWGR